MSLPDTDELPVELNRLIVHPLFKCVTLKRAEKILVRVRACAHVCDRVCVL
jgi:hypothetical protein